MTGGRPTASRNAATSFPNAGDDGEGRIESLAARISADPGGLADAAAAARVTGIDEEELEALALRHFHVTTHDLIERARIEAAADRLIRGERVDEAAAAVGFEAGTPFTTAFEQRMAMSPADYTALGRATSFDLRLPIDYPTSAILDYLGRDPTSPSETVDGNRYDVAVRIGDGAVAVSVRLGEGRAHCEVSFRVGFPTPMALVHARLLSRLGLALDPAPFEAFVSARPELAKLIEGRRGLRIPLVADPFDALIWVIAGQQVSLAAAFSMRRKLILATGERVGQLIAPPAPEAVARLDEVDLGRLGFSRAKSVALRDAARAVASAELDLDELGRGSATRIERTLVALRGIGPWSANYMLMRGYGFPDCVPVGDVALREGLRRFFRLDARPDADATIELMRAFRPHRSLATFHLWRVSSGGG